MQGPYFVSHFILLYIDYKRTYLQYHTRILKAWIPSHLQNTERHGSLLQLVLKGSYGDNWTWDKKATYTRIVCYMLRGLIHQAVFLLQWSVSSVTERTLQVSKLILFQIFFLNNIGVKTFWIDNVINEKNQSSIGKVNISCLSYEKWFENLYSELQKRVLLWLPPLFTVKGNTV